MTRQQLYGMVRQSDLEINGNNILDVFYSEAKIWDSSKVFIGGFSQGAIMAHASFLLIKDKIPGGIISFSGL